MKYMRFELLVLSVGALAILGTVLLTLDRTSSPEEIFTQALVLLVLVGALHWGRKGGLVAGGLAVVAYILIRTPLVVRDGLTPDVVTLIMTRVTTFALLGVVGGELCGRIRYVFARLDGRSNIDEATSLFNQRSISRVLRSELGQYNRYGRVFSVVVLSLSAEALTNRGSFRKGSVLRAVGGRIRGNLRLVDDVARLDDGRFLLMLPSTDKQGATVVANRVGANVRKLLDVADEQVCVEVLGVEEDLNAIKSLCGETQSDGEPRVAA